RALLERPLVGFRRPRLERASPIVERDGGVDANERLSGPVLEDEVAPLFLRGHRPGVADAEPELRDRFVEPRLVEAAPSSGEPRLQGTAVEPDRPDDQDRAAFAGVADGRSRGSPRGSQGPPPRRQELMPDPADAPREAREEGDRAEDGPRPHEESHGSDQERHDRGIAHALPHYTSRGIVVQSRTPGYAILEDRGEGDTGLEKPVTASRAFPSLRRRSAAVPAAAGRTSSTAAWASRRGRSGRRGCRSRDRLPQSPLARRRPARRARSSRPDRPRRDLRWYSPGWRRRCRRRRRRAPPTRRGTQLEDASWWDLRFCGGVAPAGDLAAPAGLQVIPLGPSSPDLPR